jgi:hypothetical protein
MQYIIRHFNQEMGQLTVEYAGEWVYAVDLPIENNAFPVGEKLEEVIQNMAPVWQQERKTLLSQAPLNADIIQALVQPYPPVEEDTQNQGTTSENI